MKKISILLVVFISILFAQSTFAQFSGGDGSSGSPYQITNGAQLDSIRYYLSSYFILNNDISLSAFQSGAGWVPINNFTGNLNGNGKKITDLKINSSSSYMGLFGSGASGATIANLGLENIDIVTTSGFSGGLIGSASGAVVISNCYVTGTISGDSWIGGLIGTTQVVGSSISNCYSRTAVTGGTSDGIGGLIGAYTVDATTVLDYCYSTGAVSTTGSKGGLIAALIGSGLNATACFWDTESSGAATSAGGAGVVGKTTAEMQTQSTFTDAGWDFTTVWKMVGTNYPTLRVMSAPEIDISAASINFGVVPVSTVKKDSVLVSNAGIDTLYITGISSNNGRFTFTPATMTLAGSASAYLVVTFTPSDSTSQLGSISLTHNAAGSPSSVPVIGKGSITPGISISASIINFGSVQVSTEKKDSVLISSTGTDTLRITGISSSNARFTFSPTTMTLAPSASSYLVVTFAPADTNNQSGLIILTHNEAGSPDTITVSGKGSPEPAAQISFSANSINFGTVIVGNQKKDSVLVSNTGTDTLEITGISSTNARFTFVPATITLLPSGSGYLVVTFSPADNSAQSGFIILTHNAAGSPDTVSVSGTGSSIPVPVPQISFSANGIDFGTVQIGSEKKDSILVSNIGTGTLQVVSILSINSNYTVTPVTMTLAPSGSSYLVVTFTPADTSYQSGSIILSHNASGSPSTITAYGKGSITFEPEFSVSATSINFGTVQVGIEKKDSVLVSNSGNDTLRITQISSNNARFTVTPANMVLAPSGNGYLIVIFTPADAIDQSGTIILTHNASGSPGTVSVSGKGSPIPVPQISISASSIDFGTITVGTEKKDSIRISNTGTAALQITGISSNNARFTVAPATMTLSPSGNGYLVITFAPADNTDQSGSIVLTHNAASSPDTVIVSGKGSPTVGVDENNARIPTEYNLGQNYPNPFNPTTMVTYSIPSSGFVSIVVYDILGREIQTLVDKHQEANIYSIKFDAHELRSGVYFVKLIVTDNTGALRYNKTNKMLFAK